MVRSILFSVLLLSAISIKSQQWQWAKTVNVPVSAEHNVMEPDKQGNFYVGVNSGVGTCLIKFDAQGTELWRKCISGGIKISGLAANANDLYIAGSFIGTLTAMSNTFASAGKEDAYMMRLTSAGNLVWAKTFGGPEKDVANDIVQDMSMNLRVTGEYASTVSFDQTVLTCSCTSAMFMGTYDPSGTLLNVKSTDCLWSPSSFATGEQIIVDANHDVYVLGRHSYFQFDSFEVAGGGGPYDSWYLAKIDSSGAVAWAHPTVNQTIQYLFEMALDDSGNLILNGYSQWTTGGGTITSKINPADGSIMWTSADSPYYCPGDQGVSQGVATQNGNSYIYGSVRLGTNCSPGRNKTLLIKYNSAGQQVFVDTVDLSVSYYNFDIIRILPDAFVVSAVMGPGTMVFGTHTVSAYDEPKLVIARFNDPGTTTSLASSKNRPQFRAFPNPASGSFEIKGLSEGCSLQVTNALGSCIYTRNDIATDEIRINLSEQPAGIYFVRVSQGNAQSVIKVIKE